MACGSECGVDCRQLPAKRGLRGGGGGVVAAKRAGLLHWDHRALARDLGVGPGLRCLWARGVREGRARLRGCACIYTLSELVALVNEVRFGNPRAVVGL